MEKIKKGDIVGRISYGQDIIFEVKRIIKSLNGEKIAILKGVTERIEVDSKIEDLIKVGKDKLKNEIKKIDTRLEKRIIKNQQMIEKTYKNINREGQKYKTGKILHLDGDRKYSQKSLKYYQGLGLNAVVKNVAENRQSKVVYNLLLYYKPDILVITGHDGMIKKDTGYNDLYNYRNSRHFIETVKQARRYEKDTGRSLVIFAGACQSYFEAIMMAGANFASSPARILIDILDPLIVAEKVAITDDIKYITIEDIEGELRDGRRGVGGIGARRKKKENLTLEKRTWKMGRFRKMENGTVLISKFFILFK